MAGDNADGAPADSKPAGQDADQGADAKPGPADNDDQSAGRSDPFADAVSDPLTEAAGGTAGRSSEQAYRMWVRTVQASGPAAVFGGGSFRDVHIGGTTIYASDRRASSPGSLRTDAIESLILRYVPISCYGSLVQRLETSRLLALRGG